MTVPMTFGLLLLNAVDDPSRSIPNGVYHICTKGRRG